LTSPRRCFESSRTWGRGHAGPRPHETLAFAHAIRLVPCFTPVRSPESNGIAEAFVKTFKRDYVRLNPRPDPLVVMAELDRWFEDYNEMHPHRALGMCSPRQFVRAHQPATCPV
jgi:putative transposase